MTEKKEGEIKKQKNEICWNLVNSGIAGALVLFGSFTTGKLTWESFVIAGFAAVVVFITKFSTYWSSQEGEYKTPKLFKFL
jgi:hypothetical protein